MFPRNQSTRKNSIKATGVTEKNMTTNCKKSQYNNYAHAYTVIYCDILTGRLLDILQPFKQPE